MPASSAPQRQFRKVGPMLLRNATPEDLVALRNTVACSSPVIKYIAFYRLVDGSSYHVYAQAASKLSPACWKGAIHKRLENVVYVEDLREALEQVRANDTFEQYGDMCSIRAYRKTASPITKKPVPPVTTQSASTMPDCIQRLIGHIKPRNGYLMARKVFLQLHGVNVPDDYDTSDERAREFELAYAQQGKQQATETPPAVVSVTKALPKRPAGKKFVRRFKYNTPAPAKTSVPSGI